MANDAVTILGHCYCYPSVAVVAEVVSSFVLVTTFGVPNFASVKLHTALHILPIQFFGTFFENGGTEESLVAFVLGRTAGDAGEYESTEMDLDMYGKL